MNTPAAPPSFNPISRESGRKRFVMAANASLAAASSAFVFAFVSGSLLSSLRESLNGTALKSIAIGGMLVVSLLVLVAIVAGVVALVGAARHGARGLLGRGLFGVLVSVLLAAIMIPNFLAAWNKARQARVDFRAAVTNLSRVTGEEIADPGRVNERLADAQAAMNQAAVTSSGDEAKVMRATAASLGRIQAATDDYSAKVLALESEGGARLRPPSRRGL